MQHMISTHCFITDSILSLLWKVILPSHHHTEQLGCLIKLRILFCDVCVYLVWKNNENNSVNKVWSCAYLMSSQHRELFTFYCIDRWKTLQVFWCSAKPDIRTDVLGEWNTDKQVLSFCLTSVQHLSALIRQEVCQKNFKKLINFKDKGDPLTVESLQYLFIPVEIWIFGISKYLEPAQLFCSHFRHEMCFV